MLVAPIGRPPEDPDVGDGETGASAGLTGTALVFDDDDVLARGVPPVFFALAVELGEAGGLDGGGELAGGALPSV